MSVAVRPSHRGQDGTTRLASLFFCCVASIAIAGCGDDPAEAGTTPGTMIAPTPPATTDTTPPPVTTTEPTPPPVTTMEPTPPPATDTMLPPETDGAGGMMGIAGVGGMMDMPTDDVMIGDGTCCSDGDCICRDAPPAALTLDDGPYNTTDYSLNGVGCIYHPTDAEPPFSAVAIADGFGGTGGCGRSQTSGWGNFLASWGIVTMIIETGSGDQPGMRGDKLLRGIQGFKDENDNPSSPIFGQLAGRYGTSGFSMGGGGTTFAASDDPTLLSSVAIMAWTPTGRNVTVPTLFTCGSSDTLARCMASTAYGDMPDTTPKMLVTVPSGHAGQPTSGQQGRWGLAWHKTFLDGDERWKELLLAGDYDQTSLQ